MDHETAIYLANILVTLVLAVEMTHYWVRRERAPMVRDWMASAWVLVVADVIFALRPELPQWVSRTLPTLLVTAGLAVLLSAARRTADLPPHYRRIVFIVALHAAILVAFLTLDHSHSHLRTATNGVLWGSLAFASFRFLRHGAPAFWNSIVAPANVFLLHGIFHACRAALAIWFEVRGMRDAAGMLQLVGDLEVAFFVVALFGSLLTASLLTRYEALEQAMHQVRTLSGLLPICAWCSRIRDDQGYWSRVDDYIASHSDATVTHSICSDCAAKQGKPTLIKDK
ncbi:MAG TPA: hypothetical protein PLL69_04725 [Gemmatimonadales bacterium]|nr:hypothetical protein [Gemmatimonadales bacterium]